ncbi:unnamed protein product [Sphenostylis stenocarpa]|uniref:BHLH domain-containing protein n=1 Tax=Sphenostylis stenocarpa TaxID=92480 RepID=A0AA86S2N4_9FABA|nr:unnamed protein product [Sphenostylis stenocarpa]
MAEDEYLLDMDFPLGNHIGTSSSSNHSSERKEKKKPWNQQQQGALMNKKQNPDIGGENEKKIIASGEGTCLEINNEMHPSIERERRKKMKEMFEDLSGLLPQLPSKVDKATIINEAVNHIKVLQETLEKLERKKQERAQDGLKQIMGTTTSGAVSVSGKQKVAFEKTWAASNMVLNIRGNEAQFSICSVHKPGLMTNIASVLEKHNIELISATISANGIGNTCMIQVHGKQACDGNSSEETYRKAAEEIMPWIA